MNTPSLNSPGHLKPGPKPKRAFEKVSSNPAAFAELCLNLMKFKLSRPQLVERVGIADTTVRKWMKYLKQRDMIWICERRRTSLTGACLLIYHWNHEFQYTDIPVVRMSQLQYDRRSNIRKKLRLIEISPIRMIK